MAKIRPSFKRLHFDEWKDWQKEAYLGIHTGFNLEPVTDARGYQYIPEPVTDYQFIPESVTILEPIPVYATVRPYSAFDKPAPQVELRMRKMDAGALNERATGWRGMLEWLRTARFRKAAAL